MEPRETRKEELEQVSPIEVQAFLKGVDYPATKQELVACAKEHHAPQNVIDVIERLDCGKFEGPHEVQEAYGNLWR